METSNNLLAGYGDVACNTPVGRLMTVIYAIVGIPLMLITLNDLGKFLYKTISNAVRWKSRISRIFDTQRKITLQQKDLDLPQLEASGTLISTGTGVEIWAEHGDNNEAKKIQFQLSVEATEGDRYPFLFFERLRRIQTRYTEVQKDTLLSTSAS